MATVSLWSAAILRLVCYWGIVATLVHLVYKLSPVHGNIISVLTVMHLVASQIILINMKSLRKDSQ